MAFSLLLASGLAHWLEKRRLQPPTVRAAYECVRPAVVYQTLRGPFDSIGLFFRCRARGESVA